MIVEELDFPLIEAVYGSLTHNNWTHNRVVSYWSGASFSNTEELIEKTLNKFLETMGKDLDELESAIDQGASNNEILKHALKYKADATQAVMLQQGIKNIEKAFQLEHEESDEILIKFSNYKDTFNHEISEYVGKLHNMSANCIRKLMI